ncbi:MAG: endolytic transglycosylase MltG [Rhodospirillales bacterium]|nr:endolytic transglycosylase MltG [Rhodospirillales bacterium]
MRRLLAALAALAVIAAVAGGGAWYARRRYVAPGPLAAARDVVVPPGTIRSIGAVLKREGVIANPLWFRAAAELTSRQGPLRAAEFAFPAHASLAAVLGVLRHARPVEHPVTIAEGLTAAAIARELAATPFLAGPAPVPPEGAVLPQTYDVTLGTPRTALLARAEAAMRTTLARVWAGRAPDLPLTSPEQLLTLASIVERETALPAERAHIAGVFINRLRLGMPLQSDPTVAYAVSGGQAIDGATLTTADLRVASPYNTYRVKGLPPGPICSPGLASLQAAAHPLATKDLYFVANGTGGHAFAATLAQHDINVAHWRALQKSSSGGR